MPSETVTIALISAASGLLGALIGGMASVFTTVAQERSRARLERVRLATEVACKDLEAMLQRFEASGRRVRIMPIALWIDYHIRLLSCVEKHGQVRPSDMADIIQARRALRELLLKADKENPPA